MPGSVAVPLGLLVVFLLDERKCQPGQIGSGQGHRGAPSVQWSLSNQEKQEMGKPPALGTERIPGDER
jgi:hypothetical protein